MAQRRSGVLAVAGSRVGSGGRLLPTRLPLASVCVGVLCLPRAMLYTLLLPAEDLDILMFATC